MAVYHRLNEVNRLEELGFRLSEGVQVLPPEAFAPVAEATRLLDEARAQARAIVADAENVREAERRRGHAEGLAEGRLEAVRQTLREARELDARLEALEGDITDIVMVSMRKLIGDYDDAVKAAAVVRGALRQMRREKKAEIRVAPELFPQLRAAVDGIVRDFPGFELVEAVEDATLSGDTVIVDTGIGRVEGNLASRLDELDAIVRGLLPGTPAAAATEAAAEAGDEA